MTTAWLLDGNALVALVLEGHVHHDAATRWFAKLRGARFATCVVTQGTLLRLHMTMATDASAVAAWATLASVASHAKHVFWDDGFGYEVVAHRDRKSTRLNSSH